MDIRNVIHKGLRRFLEDDDVSGLNRQAAEKIRNMVSFLLKMETVAELKNIPSWKAHPLTGNEKGKWSLTVTRNWRLTFRIDEKRREIFDLNYEDYH